MQTRHLSLIAVAVGFLVLVGIAFAVLRGPIGSTLGSPTLGRLADLSARDVDTLVIRSAGDSVTLRKLEARWMVEERGVFPARLDALWEVVADLDKVPTIARNPDNHARLGVTDSDAMSVTFLHGDKIAGELLVGNFSADSQATFVRRPGVDAVAMVAGDLEAAFGPRFDEWRDPTIVDAASVLVRSLKFTYPDEEFEVKIVIRSSTSEFETTQQLLDAQTAAIDAAVTRGEGPLVNGQPIPTATPDPGRPSWVIQSAGREVDANPTRILFLLRLMAPLLADGFEDDLWEELAQREPAWTLEVGGSGFGSLAFLQFYPKDEDTYYVRKAGARDVFLLDDSRAAYFRSRISDLEALRRIEGGLSGAS
mgnify:CR=1 FL=1